MTTKEKMLETYFFDASKQGLLNVFERASLLEQGIVITTPEVRDLETAKLQIESFEKRLDNAIEPMITLPSQTVSIGASKMTMFGPTATNVTGSKTEVENPTPQISPKNK